MIRATASLGPWLWSGPGDGSRYHCSAGAAAELRSRRAAGSGPLRRGRAEAGRESAPAPRSRDGRPFLRSAGAISAGASLAPALWGGPGDGSRYHCSAVAAAELRSRQAAGSRPLRPGRAEAGRASAPTIPEPATGGLLCAQWGSFLRALAWSQCVGADPGRVALPLLRRRSGGAPDPPGGGLAAASARAGRSGESERAIADPATGGRFLLRLRSFLPAPPGSPGLAPERGWARPAPDGRSRPRQKEGQRAWASPAAGAGAQPPGAERPDRRRAGDGAVVPPPRRGGEDGSAACAGTQSRAEARVPRQPGLRRAASRRLGEPAAPSAVATAGKGKQCGSPQAARSGPLRPGRAEAARESAPPLPVARWAGCFSLGGGQSCHRFLGAGALGRTRGRVALPMRRRRRDGGPPFPLSRQAARSGPLRPGRAEAARESAPPLPVARWAGCFSLGGGQSCHRFLDAGALGRTRGRVALPMRRRRRDGGPPFPLSRQAVGSGPLRPGGPKRREGACAIADSATGGLSCAPRGAFLPGPPWRQRLGADPGTGRATNAPSPARRRSAAPLVPPGGGLGAASAGGRSGERGRAIADSATGGLSCAPRGAFLPGPPWRQRLGADPGRVALPLRRRRRDGGPPLPLSRQAVGSGPLRPAAEAASEGAPLPIPPRAGFPALRGGHFCQGFLGASALERTRAGSRYHCAVAGATAVRLPSSPGEAGSGPLRRGRAEAERERAPIREPATGGLLCAQWGSFLRALAWPGCVGADPRPGRATSAPSPARRRSGVPRSCQAGGLGAASARAGRSGGR